MSIKELVINCDLEFCLYRIAFLGVASIASISYYSYDSQDQVIECEANDLNTFINENGQICCIFNEGQHRIKVSRNDAYYHKINSVDGYSIESVDVNGWRDNNQVIYVNTKPVIAIGISNKDGKIAFDDFGEVITSDLSLEKTYQK